MFYPKYPNDELKACPCCGITASFSQNSEYIGGCYVYNAWIQCKNRNCGLMIPAKPIDDDNKDEVIASLMAKWNKRDDENDMINTWVRDVTKSVNKKFYIDEMISWATFSEDKNNSNIRVSIRSRGPIINEAASKFGGGGHIYASGAKLSNFEDCDKLVEELDRVCKEYKQLNM